MLSNTYFSIDPWFYSYEDSPGFDSNFVPPNLSQLEVILVSG